MLGAACFFGDGCHFGVDSFGHGGHGVVDVFGEGGFFFVNGFVVCGFVIGGADIGFAGLGGFEEGAVLVRIGVVMIILFCEMAADLTS